MRNIFMSKREGSHIRLPLMQSLPPAYQLSCYGNTMKGLCRTLKAMTQGGSTRGALFSG